MIRNPNNNTSVLPWYASIEEMNSRKPYAYGQVYPLFAPASRLLPFQVMRPHRGDTPGATMAYDDGDTGYIGISGTWWQNTTNFTYVYSYAVSTSLRQVYLVDCPAPYLGGTEVAVMAAAYGTGDTLLGTFSPITSGTYSGVWNLPEGTVRIRVGVDNSQISDIRGSVHEVTHVDVPVTGVTLYRPDGTQVSLPSLASAVSVVEFAERDYDVLVYPASNVLEETIGEGIHRMSMTDGTDTWYSEQFTVVKDITPYLKLEWWDDTDLTTDFGCVVYSAVPFRNVLYLSSELAMPEYTFEEEGEDREGYFFPSFKLSEKTYRFTAVVPEYLADAMRIARLSDHVQVTDRYGRIYDCDTFSFELEWQEQGLLASVDAEFQTDTVIKHCGIVPVGEQESPDTPTPPDPSTSSVSFQNTRLVVGDGYTAPFIMMCTDIVYISVSGIMGAACNLYGSSDPSGNYLAPDDPSWTTVSRSDSDTWVLPSGTRHVKIAVEYASGMPSPMEGTFIFGGKGGFQVSQKLTIERSGSGDVLWEIKFNSTGNNKAECIRVITEFSDMDLAEAKAGIESGDWFGEFTAQQATSIEDTCEVSYGADVDIQEKP